MADCLARFEADWLARLNQGAIASFHHAAAPADAGLYSAVADAFVSGLGYATIGFNWELLDANAGPADPRSALGEITKALANDISNPSKAWLGDRLAAQCARDLIAAFDTNGLTVVSNRYDGLWNPISGAQVEWGFVCFDDRNIALLLVTEPT